MATATVDTAPSKDSIITAARERYKLVSEFDEKQREREKSALRFQVPELQWSDEDRAARAGDGGAIPPRPLLAVSKLAQPLSLVLNQMRTADFGIEVHPVSPEANTENAEIRQGLYRFIEQDSHAEQARTWAFDRALKCGRGAYRILTEYDPEGGDPSDQKIVIRRIKRQEGVYFDPSANEPDFSDGEFVFVLAWMKESEFRRRWPESKSAKLDHVGWEGVKHEAPDWVRKGDVLVGEYWFKQHESVKFQVGEEERERDEVTVYRAMIAGGYELLEDLYQWRGKLIPIVPVIGLELQSFDEETRYVGMVEPAMGAQKFSNYAITSLVERMALEPRAPWVVNEEVIEGYEDYWKQSNVRNFPMLPFKTVVREGVLLPAPTRAVIDSTGMSISLMAAQEADSLIQTATAVFDPSLGKLPQKERSGKAIMALQSQADAGTSGFIQNLVDISMTYEARCVSEMMPVIYDRAERVIRIVRGDDKKVEPAMVNAPSIVNPQTKMPQAAPPMRPGQQPPPNVKNYTMTTGTYGVTISIGKSFQSRLQEGAERMGELLSKRPDLFIAVGDLWLDYQDFPGAKEMSKRMARWREKTMPGLGEGEDGAPDIEQMKAQMEAMNQKGQEQAQMLQMAMQKLETEAAKQQATMMKAQMDTQAAMAKAQLDSDTKLRISAADNETKLAIAGLSSQLEALLTTLKLDHEARKIEAAQAHESSEAEQTRRGEAALTAMGQEAPERPEAPEPAEMPEMTEPSDR